jgi:hypothetical protein
MIEMNDNQVISRSTASAALSEQAGYDEFYGGGVLPPAATLWDELSQTWLQAARERLERTLVAARLTGV